MGFHRRYITNKLVRYCYSTNGIDSLKQLLTADAFISEEGISLSFLRMANNERVCWLKIEKMIYKDIYNKGTGMLTEAQKINVAVILADNAYSRDQKLIELKAYLSKFKSEFDADGIEYTFLASQILKEYYEEFNRTRDIRR